MSCKYSYFDDGIFLCSLRRHKQQCILGKPDLKKCMANGYKKYILGTCAVVILVGISLILIG